MGEGKSVMCEPHQPAVTKTSKYGQQALDSSLQRPAIPSVMLGKALEGLQIMQFPDKEAIPGAEAMTEAGR